MPDRYTKIMLTNYRYRPHGPRRQNAVNSGRAAPGVQHVVICIQLTPTNAREWQREALERIVLISCSFPVASSKCLSRRLDSVGMTSASLPAG